MNRRLGRIRGRITRFRFEAPGFALHRLLRPHASGVNRDVVVESWDAIADGAHNSNTDLTFFDGRLYLCHQTSPCDHVSSAGMLRLASASGAPTTPAPV